MIVYNNKKDTDIKSNVELDMDLMVTRCDKLKSDSSLKYIKVGDLVLSQETLDFIEEEHSVYLEVGLYPALIKQRELAVYINKQRFHDIGTLEQLKTFEEYLRREFR